MNCANCDGNLSNDDVLAGRCSICGRPVAAADVATMDLPTDSGAADPARTGTADSRSIAATLESGRAGGVTPPPPVDVARYAATQDELDQPGVQRRLHDLWSANVRSDTDQRQTLKPQVHQVGEQTHLVICARRLQGADEPGGGVADYKLEGKLGEGGMGVVLSARQMSINRSVAVKLLKPAAVHDPIAREKFLSEAAVTGDLEHPNIVPVYDLGKDQANALFYAMKQVRGTPWSKVLREKTLEENLDVLLRVADATAYAHSREVIHRDIKPENVMLGSFGEVLLMDWGLAVSAQIDPAVSGMAGTPAYMAPEMALGPVDRVGPASDVYLLGAVLYEIITGKPPHHGRNAMDCLTAAARNQIEPCEQSGELVDIALRAMATNIADRYPSVVAFQQAIREHLSHRESLSLSRRALEDLEEARASDHYDGYARALFGFQEAKGLWTDNREAEEGAAEASHAYAGCAFRRGDYDLSTSLLDPAIGAHAALLEQVRAAQQERDSRQRRLRAAKRVFVALVSTIFVIITVAFFWIRAAYQETDKQRALAVKGWNAAETAREEEARQKTLAETNERAARAAERAAEQARAAEETQKKKAVAAAEGERQQRLAAERAELKEKLAKHRQEYESYIAQIGLAAAKIDENAFDVATGLLESCSTNLRHWEWGRLKDLCRRDLRTFEAAWPLEAVALSPDGNFLAVGGWSDRVRVWNIASGEVACEFSTGAGRVFALAFSPDGARLAVGSNARGRYVTLWNAATGDPAGAPSGHTDAVLSLAFSRDGKRLLTGSYDNTARVWNLETGRADHTFAHEWWVWSAAFSHDEQSVVTACQDGSARVWSVKTGEAGPPFLGHAGPVYAAAFAPDDRTVATAGYDTRVLLWQPDKVPQVDMKRLLAGESVAAQAAEALDGHTGPVRALMFSTDGTRLVTAGFDNTLRVWDVGKRKLIKTLRGHAGRVAACAFTADGQRAVSASHDRLAKLWDVAGYEEVRVLQGHVLHGHRDAVLGAAFSPDGARIATASRDRTARVWDVASGAMLRQFREGHGFLVSSAAFSPDGRRLVTAAADNSAIVWRTDTGTELVRLRNTGTSAALAISTDGRRVLTGGEAYTAQLWDAETGERLHTLSGHRSEITAVAISPDGRWLLTADAGGHCRLWDAQTGAQRWHAANHSRGITAAVFLPNSERILTSSRDNSVAQWDVATGQEVPAGVLKHPDAVTSMALSADGTRLLTACADAQIRLWDLAARRVLGTLEAKDEAVTAVAFSPDGRLALSTHFPQGKNAKGEMVIESAGKVRLWDLAAMREMPPPAGPLLAFTDDEQLWKALFHPGGKQVLTLAGDEACLWDLETRRPQVRFYPHGSLAAVAYAPDGTQLMTGSWDNSARIWTIDTGKDERKFEQRHRQAISAVAYSPDGTRALTASEDGTCILWNVATGAPVHTLAEHRGPVRAALFSRDAARVLTAGDDKTAKLWDAATGKLLCTLAGHDLPVLSAALSPDGKRALLGSADNSASIWDVSDPGHAQELFRLRGHTAGIAAVAFSPDGRRALTGSQDRTAKLWDARTKQQILQEMFSKEELSELQARGVVLSDLLAEEEMRVGKEILTLNEHVEEVTAVGFSPDGRIVFTASRDGRAILRFSAPVGEARAAHVDTRRSP